MEAVMATAAAVSQYVSLEGPGPFQLPILIYLGSSVEIAKHNQEILIELAAQDGKKFSALLSFHAAEQMVIDPACPFANSSPYI
jgi:hypothetical protein